MNKLGLSFFIICYLFVPLNGLTQNNKIDTSNKTLALHIENLNFIKNNEYFNNIADGYTLLGSYFHPKLNYTPSNNIYIEFGVFGLTYAGLDKYHKIIPTFSFNYLMKDAQLTMGTLHNNQGHKLIAPLMAFESQLDERSVENGIQYFLHKKNLELDSWINWEHFIFKGDTKNEEFVMGISANYQLLDKQKWQLKIPFQNLFYHRGGQINTNETQDRTVFTMHHTAIGLQASRKIDTQQSIHFSSFYLRYKSGRIPQEYIITNGKAFLTNINYTYKDWKIGIGYWYGDHFVSPKGDEMFQSVSMKTDIYYENGILEEIYRDHIEPKRTLLLGELSYHKKIAKKVNIGVHFNTFFQNYPSNSPSGTSSNPVSNQLDYSMGLYIRYLDSFHLMSFHN